MHLFCEKMAKIPLTPMVFLSGKEVGGKANIYFQEGKCFIRVSGGKSAKKFIFGAMKCNMSLK